jgi:hypothetical protein
LDRGRGDNDEKYREHPWETQIGINSGGKVG